MRSCRRDPGWQDEALGSGHPGPPLHARSTSDETLFVGRSSKTKGDTMNRSALAVLVVVIMVVFGVKAEAADWETDFAKASTNASKSGLYMLLDFRSEEHTS